MNKIYTNKRNYFIFIFVLFVLVGCTKNNSKLPSEDSLRLLSKKITPVYQFEKKKKIKLSKISEKKFERKLTLKFSPKDKEITELNKKRVSLFFQTLPVHKKIEVHLTVAPVADGERFNSFKMSWTRTQAMKKLLKKYAQNIKDVYSPSQIPDTVNIKISGG